MKFKALFFLIICCFNANAQRPNFLKKDSIVSTMDGNNQVFFYEKSLDSYPKPLVVELHSWSNTAESQKDILAQQAYDKDWNYLLPNFRGVNNTPKACCSEFVIADIDESIDWALENMHVDKRHIYVIGVSGGGYATLAMYMKSRHKISSFSAWAAISDLDAWYKESVERKNKYAAEIIQCVGNSESFDSEAAMIRSPLYWETPNKNADLQIYAGIHDGYTGSVPISHSINFYNKLLKDRQEKKSSKYISASDIKTMLETQKIDIESSGKMIGDREVLYQNASKNVSITIFEGTHEMLTNAALDLLK
jgi:predicted peptidase